jgi:hypothetical protein
MKCAYCKGRGWAAGECHPRELCDSCEGTGEKDGRCNHPIVVVRVDRKPIDFQCGQCRQIIIEGNAGKWVAT